MVTFTHRISSNFALTGFHFETWFMFVLTILISVMLCKWLGSHRHKTNIHFSQTYPVFSGELWFLYEYLQMGTSYPDIGHSEILLLLLSGKSYYLCTLYYYMSMNSNFGIIQE